MRVPFLFRPGETPGDGSNRRKRAIYGVAVGIALLLGAGLILSRFVRVPTAPSTKEIRQIEDREGKSETSADLAKEMALPSSAGFSGQMASVAEPRGKVRKIASSHTLNVEVLEFQEFYDWVSRVALESGGYNTEENRSKSQDGRMHGRVSMRVPREEVGGILGRIRERADVIRESGSSEDLTEQYYDLEARLKNAKAAEARLAEILRVRTGKLSDVLEVEREMTRVRGEIESMEARKRSMEVRTETVSITVDIWEPERSSPAARRMWTPIRTAFGQGLMLMVMSVRILIIAAISILPWVVVAAAVLAVARRLGRRGKPFQDEKGGDRK